MENKAIINFNNRYRDMMSKWFNRVMLNGYDVNEAAQRTMDYLYSLENSNDKYVKLFREYLIYVLYLDAYKVYNYKVVNNSATDDEMEFYMSLCNIEDYIDLLTEVSSNIEFFRKIIISCYEFNLLDYLGKCSYVCSLSKDETATLTEKIPIHQQDVDYYSQPISLDFLVNEFDRMRLHQDRVMQIEFDDGLFLKFISFLRSYYFINRESTIKLLIEIGALDYRFIKYVSDNGICDGNNDLRMNYYIEHNITEIVEKLLFDKDFLRKAFEAVIHTYLDKEFDGIDLDVHDYDGDDDILKKFK